MPTLPPPFQRVLLLGGRGMLAQALDRSLRRRGVTAASVDSDGCDITDAARVGRLFEEVRPTLVLNAAAYTAVDKAEQEEDLATRVNGAAVGHLVRAAGDHGAVLVHFSTDFVFDGAATSPYAIDAATSPLSAYGRSKLAGEQALKTSGYGGWLCLRTSWLYGPWAGRPFPKVMIEAARAGKPLSVVSDQRGSPTFTPDLAEAALALVEAGARGMFHCTGAGETSWFEFCRRTLDVFGIQPTELKAITSAEWDQMRPGTARRPAYSVLDCSATAAAIGRPLRHWEAGLRDYHALTAGNP